MVVAVISSITILGILVAVALQTAAILGHASRQPRSGSSRVLLFACDSINYEPGVCVLLEQCPPLLRILTDGPHSHTAENIRLLQRLTCGFETEERPMVCCPSAEITRHPSPLPPAPKEPPLSLSLEDEFFPDLTQDFRNHPNFRLLPNVTKCGNRLEENEADEHYRLWLEETKFHCHAVGGRTAALASYPWMALLGYRNKETGKMDFNCGGTIINNRYILTAAHCLKDLPEIVRLGEHDTSTDLDCSEAENICVTHSDVKVEEVMVHEHALKSNDIGLVRLAREISFEPIELSPVCLPFPLEYGVGVLERWKADFEPWEEKGRWLIVTGWGKTRWDNQEGSTELQEVQLPLVRSAECQANYMSTVRRGRIVISPKQMCAGGLVDKDSCGGDSGGPLHLQITNNCITKTFQVGIVSFGPKHCGSGQIPGVYSRISSYRKWILDHIRP